MNRFTKYKIFRCRTRRHRKVYLVEKYFLGFNIKTVGIADTRFQAMCIAEKDNNFRKTRFYNDAKGRRI